MVLLESMTLGLPCVAVDILPVRHVLQDGFGLLTAPVSQDLAKGMLRVVDGGFTPKPFDPEAYNRDAVEDFYKVIGLVSA